MSNERITKFNHIVGASPKGLDSDNEDIWQQIELQARLLLEEATEMYTAAVARDIVEVLDGSIDVWYIREYMDDILKALNVDVAGAKYEVCFNNDQKYTTSEDLAMETWLKYVREGKTPEVCSVNYEGKTYYTVKIEGKVQKLIHHVRPNLDKCIPQETKEKLNVAS